MTDNQYGNYQTPSSRPPEPPYRATAQSGQPAYGAQMPQPHYSSQQPYNQPDTSGIDRSGEIPATSSFEPAPATQSAEPATESFQEARGGDTGTMPASFGTAPLVQGQPQAGGTQPFAAQQQDASSPQAGARQGGYQAAGYAQPQAASYAQAQPASAQTQAAAAQQAGAAAVGAHAQIPKKGGSGKTFLFGFLGALAACLLFFGAMQLVGNRSAVVSETYIGSTDPSVINAVDEGQTLAEAVAAKALPSVVAVYNYQEQAMSNGFGYGYVSDGSDELTATGMGSGVVISDDGYILTNYHVVEDADKLTVTVEGVERDAEYVGGDSSSDIAVVKVEDTTGLVAADLGDSDDLRIGEWVMTVGAPLGLEQSVATGVVSATNRSTVMDNSSSDIYSLYYGTSAPDYSYYPNMIQTDAVINPGNSGGALVDADGKLIGINTMISSYSGDYAGVGFAIPVNYAIGIAEDIIAGKEPTHAILGVTISTVNAQTAQRNNLPTSSGAYITYVSPDSGADGAGLKVGDIITHVNGKEITSTTDVTLDVREHNVGDTVTVTVNRNGETLDFDVVLSSDENANASAGEDQEGQEGREMGQGYGNGRGNGYGYGQGNGFDRDELEELLHLFGM